MPLHMVINPPQKPGKTALCIWALPRLKALEPEWLMVALADQPLLETGDLKDLIAAVKQAPVGTQMLQPTVNGQPGNPVMLSDKAHAGYFANASVRRQSMAATKP